MQTTNQNINTLSIYPYMHVEYERETGSIEVLIIGPFQN